MTTDRGFFEIGIIRGKTVENVGTLWRSAYQMGASGIFTVGQRYPKQASDTLKANRHIPLRTYIDIEGIGRDRLLWSDGSGWHESDGQRGGVALMARVGKKAAGRLLDGRTHDEFPE